MKKCLKCGAEVENEIITCPACEATEFSDEIKDATVFTVESIEGVLTSAEGAVTLPAPKKKFNWLPIILIIVGVLALSVALYFIIGSGGDEDENKGSSAPSTVSVAEVPFTVGAVKDGYYVNEWANLKMPVGDWELASKEMLSSQTANEKNVGYMLYANKGDTYSDNRRELMIIYEDISDRSKGYAAEDYLAEKIISQLVTDDMKTEKSDRKIAGATYKSIKITNTDYMGEENYSVICSRRIGNYVITVILDCNDSLVIDSVFNSFVAVK